MAQGILRKSMDMTAETRTRKTSAQETTMRTLRTSSGLYAAARCRKPVMILYLVLTQSHQLDASRQSRSLLARKSHRRTIFSIWKGFKRLHLSSETPRARHFLQPPDGALLQGASKAPSAISRLQGEEGVVNLLLSGRIFEQTIHTFHFVGA